MACSSFGTAIGVDHRQRQQVAAAVEQLLELDGVEVDQPVPEAEDGEGRPGSFSSPVSRW